MAKSLQELLQGLCAVTAQDDVMVSGLCADSRQVQPGDLFIARRGGRADGLQHLDQVVQGGAVAVLAEHGDAQALRERCALPVWVLDNLPQALGVVADRFHDHPSQALQVIGITGTNGKTSISHFIAQALHLAGKKVGVIGTLGVGMWNALHPATHTTPDVLRLHAELARQRALGVQYVVMEVSSHALDQGRVAGVRFRAAVFSNLTQDHLDYHGDMQHYAQSKRRLFDACKPQASIINMDDAFGRELLEQINFDAGVWAYGLGEVPWEAREAALVRAQRWSQDARGLLLEAITPQGGVTLHSVLLGQFNASNLLASLATLLELGMPLSVAAQALQQVRAPAGRMESFQQAGYPQCVVDYAHTPDALAQSLGTLRTLLAATSEAKLWVVFGCGGERDAGKRPQMGRIAAELADGVIVTDDNPRSENPQSIIDAILAGMGRHEHVHVERDRRAAIAWALKHAKENDVILIAGKGHEDYQEINGQRLPFSDRRVVQELMQEGKS